MISDITNNIKELLNPGIWQIYEEEKAVRQGTVITSKYKDIANFTSYVDFSISETSTNAEYPVEAGSFVTVNKTVKAGEITLILAKNGSKEEISDTIAALRSYERGKNKMKLVNVLSPFQEYKYEHHRLFISQQQHKRRRHAISNSQSRRLS